MKGRELALWALVIALAAGAAHLLRRALQQGPSPSRPPIVAPTGPKGETPTERSLGVFLEEIEDGPGLRVDDLLEDGAAAIAGIRSGDVLLAMGGEEVETPAEVQARLRALRPGEALELKVLRDGEPLGEGGVVRLVDEHFARGAYELTLARRLIRAAAEQLLDARRRDGLWPHYQRSDQPSVAVSALVAHALARAGADLPEGAGEVLDDLRQLLLGYRGFDGGLEDPAHLEQHRVYGTALLLLALPEEAQQPRSELTEWLVRAQVQEAHGYDAIDSRYGGWSYRDELRSADLRADVSTARFALLALDAADLPADHPTWHRAGLYLDLVQNYALWTAEGERGHAAERRLRDGGFGFTPRMSKALDDVVSDDLLVFRSYGSATADGLLALLATRRIDLRGRADGPRPQDPQVLAALRWLARRYSLGEVPGFEPDPVGWGGGLLFYYLAALAQGLHRAGVWTITGEDARPHRWAQEVVRRLGELHGRKGYSFRSESRLMHEDDPTIAASFALLALAAARDRLLLAGGSDVRAEASAVGPPLDPVAPPPPPSDAVGRGRALFRTGACASCHQDGVPANAPPLVGVGDVLLSRLRTEERARAHLRAFLRGPAPQASVLAPLGEYPARMPPVTVEQVDDAALEDLITYLLSRSGALPVSEDRR